MLEDWLTGGLNGLSLGSATKEPLLFILGGDLLVVLSYCFESSAWTLLAAAEFCLLAEVLRTFLILEESFSLRELPREKLPSLLRSGVASLPPRFSFY